MNSDDLAYIRQGIAEFLTDTCSIYGVSTSSDGYGGISETETIKGDNIPCYFMAGSGRLGLVAERVFEKFDGVVLLPYGTDVNAGDIIVKGTQRYKVLGELERTLKAFESVVVSRV